MKNIFTAIVFLAFAMVAVAQEQVHEKKGFRKENVFVGGNFGLAVGNYTLINLSPQLGYRFNKTLAAGIGLNLLYASEKRRDWAMGYDYRVVQGITGFNLFGRLYPIQNFMIQLQPEVNYRFGHIKYLDGREPRKTSLDAEIVPSILAGGGLVMPGESGAFIIAVMYDLLQHENSPYGQRPVINLGYNINLGR